MFFKAWLILIGVPSALANLHNVAVCVTGRTYSEVGGTPFSPSYTWAKDYEILPAETKCACDYYRQRHTGDKQWDSCPDCTFVRFLASAALQNAFMLTLSRMVLIVTLLDGTLVVM